LTQIKNELKKAVLLSLLCFSLFQCFACDICGCSSGNYFVSLSLCRRVSRTRCPTI